jgi:hypothetical protein
LKQSTPQGGLFYSSDLDVYLLTFVIIQLTIVLIVWAGYSCCFKKVMPDDDSVLKIIQEVKRKEEEKSRKEGKHKSVASVA